MKILGQQQKVALERISEFLKSDKRFFLLKGYAGTGKTSIVPEILNAAVGYEVKLMAPTGRAAKVLAEKAHAPATTIHRGIYRLSSIEVKMDDDMSSKSEAICTAKLKFYFPLDLDAGMKPRLIIVDEASMVQSCTMRDEVFAFGSGSILRDLETYLASTPGSKIIFIGDSLQLPPVGESKSSALDLSSFPQGDAEEYVLTEVVRQGSDSIILSESMKIRELLNSEDRCEFIIDEKPGELETIGADKALGQFVFDYSMGKSVIFIAYSNKKVAEYNVGARKILYGENAPEVVNGERLMIVQNNYSHVGVELMNGDFAKVEEVCSPCESRHITLREKGASSVKEHIIELRFYRVKLLLDNGERLETMLFASLLPDEYVLQQNLINRAMYVDFVIRHSKLKPGSEEFNDALMRDEYYTAVRVKYGYAVTGHKSQGGEWGTVFVDFDGRRGLDTSTLRWDYTVITRARTRLYMIGTPRKNKFSQLEVKSVIKVNGYPKMSERILNRPMTLAEKREDVENRLAGTEFTINEVKSKPYREIYLIHCPGGDYSFDAIYNKSQIFRPFTSVSNGPEIDMVLELLNSESSERIIEKYSPSTEMLPVYELVQSACESVNVTIVNVQEYAESYKVVYCLETDGKSYLDVFINSKGIVTSVIPHSTSDQNDLKLMTLLNKIEEYAKSK